jgi:hypothetical protein
LAAELLGSVAETLEAGFGGVLLGVVGGVLEAAAALDGAVEALAGAAAFSCSFSWAANRLV